MNDFLGMPESDAFTLLLAHNPAYFPAYADWGADLTLSGHVHGGLIRLPFVGGLLAPEVKLFPNYDAGVYTAEGTGTRSRQGEEGEGEPIQTEANGADAQAESTARAMIVSRGLGNSGPLLRVFNPPEVVVVTLEKP